VIFCCLMSPFFQVLVHIVVVWCFWSEVLMTVPTDSLYPLASLVAFPVGKSGEKYECA
jgi:hypothetical protein